MLANPETDFEMYKSAMNAINKKFKINLVVSLLIL